MMTVLMISGDPVQSWLEICVPTGLGSPRTEADFAGCWKAVLRAPAMVDAGGVQQGEVERQDRERTLLFKSFIRAVWF